jgi:membrane protease subunit (stomatin/prohibitin family)
LILTYIKVFKGNIPFLFKEKMIPEIKQETAPISPSNQENETPIAVVHDSNICKKCGVKLTENLNFCTECGTLIEK